MSREHARRFHFLREIASGGFGSVHLVKVMHADGFSRLVAVKLLKSQWTDSDEVARRMRDEARLLGILRHRHIVDVMDLTSVNGRAAVVMEYLEAVDLRELVVRLEDTGGRIPVRAALQVVAAVASALDAAYNRPPIPGEKPLRVIHRDIKPSNIMVDESGQVKVLDFGVARSELESRESHTQDLQFGSVDYMAPERLFFEPETPASDIYSLGATLYEVLALEKLGKARGRPERHRAFLVDRMSFLRGKLAVERAVAAELEALLQASLAFDHEQRPTAAEFYQRARTLARLAGDEELSAWAERVLPSIIQETAAARQRPSPLDDTILTEDSQVFGEVDEAPMSASEATRPTAEELRRGALAELEESGDRLVSAPPTGAPAVPGGNAPRPAPLEDWDDGPTHVAEAPDLSGINAAGGIGVPLDTEEAIGLAARNAAELPPDPADPFAALNGREMETGSTEAVVPVEVRSRPIPIPAAPWASPRGRQPRSAVERPAVDEAPVRLPPSTDDTEAPTVLLVSVEEGEEVRPLGAVTASGPGGAGLSPSKPSKARRIPPEEDSSTFDSPMGPGRARPGGPELPSLTLEASPPPSPVVEEKPAAPALAIGQDLDEDEEDAVNPPRRKRSRVAMLAAAGCLFGVGVLALAGVGVAMNADKLAAVLAGSGEPQVAVAEAGVGIDKPEAEAAPAPAAEAPDTDDGLRFVSASPGTRKLKVSCDNGDGGGDTEATVSVDKAGRCTVTAMKADRSRLTAVVDSPEAGTYRCFDGDASRCERL